MRVVVQRVKEAQVAVDAKTVGSINRGMVVFLGVAKTDSQKDVDYLVNKVVQLRIFDDKNGKMNLSSTEVGTEFLVVSQFTILGSCAKGRRPSFDGAAEPKKAEDLYESFVKSLRKQNVKVATGQFRAMMAVSLVNDGPVTFVIDSRL